MVHLDQQVNEEARELRVTRDSQEQMDRPVQEASAENLVMPEVEEAQVAKDLMD